MMQNILFIIFIACAIACYIIGRFGLENIKKYLHLIVLGFALFIKFPTENPRAFRPWDEWRLKYMYII